MDLRCIAAVKAILAEGSFQKAALRLGCTQSTITFQVRRLEKELSVRLFERIGRRMALTQAGKELIPSFDSILRLMLEIRSHGRDGTDPSGELRIAVAESLLSYRIQPVLKEFVKYAPRVKLALCSLNCHDIKDAILAGTIDMGVYYEVGGHPHNLNVIPLREFEGVLVAAPAFPARFRDFNAPNQEKDATFIINEPRSIFREIMENHLRTKNIMLRNTIELWSVEAIKKSVASNLGFSFLPRFAVERELKERVLTTIPVAMPTKTVMSICVHHHNKALSPGMKLFKELLMRSRAFQPPGRRSRIHHKD